MLIAPSVLAACMIGLELFYSSYQVVTGMPAASPVIAQDCQTNTEPTQQDIDYSLAFTKDAFQKSPWQRSYTVQGGSTDVAWRNDPESAAAELKYYIWNCGYSQADLDYAFSDEQLKDVIFKYYQNLQAVSVCSTPKGDLTLREFTADFSNAPFHILFWDKLDKSTRILTVALIFPQASKTINQYAQAIFPELPACP